jgi:ribosomal protein S4E
MLVLFCVFAFVFLLLVSAGGGVYEKTTHRMDESYEIRTTLSYISNNVRSASSRDVHITQMDGKNVLEISDSAAFGEYATYIYYYDGALSEIYKKRDKELMMEYGEEIVRTGGVDIGQTGDILTVEMTTSGGERESISLYLPGLGRGL